MADLVIRGALIVDGTGDEPRTADVAVTDGRISAIGEVGEAGDREVDGTGLMLAPGFIDPHTHYDAQLHWDPTASPSNLHGVTTIVGGNCGFTLAPLQPGDGDYVARMMAKVEGMPLEALELGLDWGWESFGDFLDRLDGAMAINAGFLVGHSALRRYVVGADGQREATAEEIEAMAQLLRSSIEAGGMGFSTSLSFTHSDGDGVPVTSRFANRDEVLTLTAVVSEYEGTSLEFVMDGCLNGYTEEEEDYILEMARVGKRPLNWNVLTVDSRKPDEYLHQLEVGARAAEEGHAVVALTMPTLPGMTQSFGTHCGLWLLPGWKHIMGLPLDQKKEYLAQSGVRHLLAELAASETGALSRLTTFARFEIGDTFSEANEGLKGRVVEDIATERGQDPFDTLVDIVLEDDFQTILWPLPTDDDDASWELRRQVWDGDGAMLGGSDAGAHLDDSHDRFVARHRRLVVRDVAGNLRQRVRLDARNDGTLADVAGELLEQLQVGKTQSDDLDFGEDLVRTGSEDLFGLVQDELVGAHQLDGPLQCRDACHGPSLHFCADSAAKVPIALLV